MTPVRDGQSRPARAFIDILPNDDARAAFRAWCAARVGAGLPKLRDFAPFNLPRRLVPWSLLYHLRADGELVYGLAGEEMIYMFHGNPKGRRILDYAAPQERAARVALLMQVIRAGLPVWFVGALLFEDKAHVPIGRLCMPVATGEGDGILLLYVALGPAPLPRLEPRMRTSFDERDVFWCTQADIDALT
ncbi:MAG: PAS domain-containing protein [Alphaproteobacteria bacterium]|nr:PAS domain-containing protein [Alphaproteobacteria bacterium]